MNKIELANTFLNNHLNQLQCPFCQAPFVSTDNHGLTCENSHSFNLSKKGSLFFLKHPVQTEYTSEMLNYRHQLLEAGFFDQMLAVVNDHLTGDLILDAGCGEGTTSKWLAQKSSRSVVGLDISKPAIEIAASGVSSEQQPLFVVGDLAKLPFADQGTDTIVNILSPSNYQEFNRILKPNGRLIKVIPGNHYLEELRQLVYPTGEHSTYDNSPVKDHFIEQYPDVQFIPIRYEFQLTSDLFKALFKMTPLTWQFQDEIEHYMQQGLPQITANFEIGIVDK